MGISYNHAILVGRLTRDPETSFSASGTQVSKFSLAVDRNYNAERSQSADFFNVVTFGKLAQVVDAYCRKGKLVLVAGEINIDQYEKDGMKRTFTKIRASQIQFLESKSKADSAGLPNESSLFFGQSSGESDDIPF
jgi:single-strand DNA-binding protein